MATAKQLSTAIIYRDASAEHVTVGRELYDLSRFALASYVSGLAVECILRAYRTMIDAEFDSRHNIERLYDLARFADIVPARKAPEIGADLGYVIALWSNDHRFLSERALRRRWLKRDLHKGIRGDFVKERTRQLLNASSEIVSFGVTRWNSLFKK